MDTLKANGAVFLAGPPCSGKTATGHILASMLEYTFYDLDSLIEKKSSSSIPDIFSQSGEEGFRKLESDQLHSLISSKHRFVLALGGGCLLSESNLQAVRQNGIIVTLTASTEVLIERFILQKGNRPLAVTEEAFIELLKKRKEHYGLLPNIIDTSELTPEQTALEVLKRTGFSYFKE